MYATLLTSTIIGYVLSVCQVKNAGDNKSEAL